jgi:hypothetical protein
MLYTVMYIYIYIYNIYLDMHYLVIYLISLYYYYLTQRCSQLQHTKIKAKVSLCPVSL